METQSSILACRIPWTDEPGSLQSMRWQRVGQDLVTFTNTHTHTLLSIFEDFPVVSVVIGRTDAEAEAPIIWPPVGKNQLIRNDPDAGKD